MTTSDTIASGMGLMVTAAVTGKTIGIIQDIGKRKKRKKKRKYNGLFKI